MVNRSLSPLSDLELVIAVGSFFFRVTPAVTLTEMWAYSEGLGDTVV